MALPRETFGNQLWHSPWEPLTVVVGGLLAITWGGSTAFTGESTWQRALGVVAAIAGVVVLVSYSLHFNPGSLEAEGWSDSRPRRVARVALTNAWWMFLIALGIIWLLDRFAVL